MNKNENEIDKLISFTDRPMYVGMDLEKYQTSDYECSCCECDFEQCYKFNEDTLNPTELNEGGEGVAIACKTCLLYAMKNNGQCVEGDDCMSLSCPFKH
jgi:hypothetical protein